MSRRTLGGRWLAWTLSLGLVAACDGKSPAPEQPPPASATAAPSDTPRARLTPGATATAPPSGPVTLGADPRDGERGPADATKSQPVPAQVNDPVDEALAVAAKYDALTNEMFWRDVTVEELCAFHLCDTEDTRARLAKALKSRRRWLVAGWRVTRSRLPRATASLEPDGSVWLVRERVAEFRCGKQGQPTDMAEGVPGCLKPPTARQRSYSVASCGREHWRFFRTADGRWRKTDDWMVTDLGGAGRGTNGWEPCEFGP